VCAQREGRKGSGGVCVFRQDWEEEEEEVTTFQPLLQPASCLYLLPLRRSEEEAFEVMSTDGGTHY
jgi:hypothetical protein